MLLLFSVCYIGSLMVGDLGKSLWSRTILDLFFEKIRPCVIIGLNFMFVMTINIIYYIHHIFYTNSEHNVSTT